jgi:putative oxidoreductase
MVKLADRYNRWLDRRRQEDWISIGLLLLRVTVGSMMVYGHGWGKLINYGVKSTTFPDPLGVGSAVSLALAVFAEFFCAVAVTVGVATRYAAIPLVTTMAVAVFVIHGNDPWGRQEFALLYLLPFLTLVLTGAGRYSLDSLIHRNKKSKNT